MGAVVSTLTARRGCGGVHVSSMLHDSPIVLSERPEVDLKLCGAIAGRSFGRSAAGEAARKRPSAKRLQ